MRPKALPPSPTMLPASFPDNLRAADESAIDKYINYDAGPLAGRCVRSELQEYQKPDLGRKYARFNTLPFKTQSYRARFAKRDRRPLDPPPVVRLRMFELLDQGLATQHEVEIPAEEIDISGLVAHLDLFPVQVPSDPNSPISQDTAINGEDPIVQERKGKKPLLYPPPPSLSFIPSKDNQTSTYSLFGSSFVHAVQMDWKGEAVIFFVFSDLSVRLEGYFTLRYRCFDLFSRTVGSDDVPVSAELYSGLFVIYSTKEFPGLQASTPLTKHLSRWGVRVNLRENDRRKPAEDSSGEDDEVEPSTRGKRRAGRSPGR